MVCYQTITTLCGDVAYTWTERGVTRVCLPQPSVAEAVAAVGVTSGMVLGRHDELADLLIRYYQGDPVDFGSVALDLGRERRFTAAVRRCVTAIGRGETMTYGEVAGAVGSPNGARAVGQVMARNPVPPLIPCHRVLGSGGLGGYGGGLELKRRLLAMERG